MDDLHAILADHRSKVRKEKEVSTRPGKDLPHPTASQIPDLFFDDILVRFKLTRIEIMALMYLYRRVWCRPNLYKIYGISPMLSHTEMAKGLGVELEDVHSALRKLEEYAFIMTVRSGQYFVRKYFLKEHDEHFQQTYDDFDV